jgi:hypothetical protein
MIIDGKDFDMDAFFIQLKLTNAVNRLDFHGQRKGGYDLSTIENLDDIEVDIELQGIEMSGVEQKSMLEQYLGNRQRR